MNRKEKALEFVDVGYNIQITGRHIEVTDAMKNYAMEKVSKIERFINRLIDVLVIMDIQKWDQRVEIIVKAGHLKITSTASSPDMYASIDKAVSKLEHQILRYKSKIQDHHPRKQPDTEMRVDVIRPLDQEELDFEGEGDEDGMTNPNANLFKPHQIVKQETHPLKTLTYEEAIMKMEVSSNPFLIFKNEIDQKLKIMYRREDGNYGIIEPSC